MPTAVANAAATVHAAAIRPALPHLVSRLRRKQPAPSGELATVELTWGNTVCRYSVRFFIEFDHRNARPGSPPEQRPDIYRVDLDEIDGREPEFADHRMYGYTGLLTHPAKMAELCEAVMVAWAGG